MVPEGLKAKQERPRGMPMCVCKARQRGAATGRGDGTETGVPSKLPEYGMRFPSSAGHMEGPDKTKKRHVLYLDRVGSKSSRVGEGRRFDGGER